MKFGETMMVFCTVTAFGKSMTAQLPVMDYRNKAIPNPDSFAVNTAMQRCLAKAIALHGLGLSLYAGEDIWNDIEDSSVADDYCAKIQTRDRPAELKVAFGKYYKELQANKAARDQLTVIYQVQKDKLNETSGSAA
jgi:hypothetical protein